jgi:superfamily II DNA/RNA helicase
MGNIADGIEDVLAQTRAARGSEKTASLSADALAPLGRVSITSEIKQASALVLAPRDEIVTVGDLKRLMEEFQ